MTEQEIFIEALGQTDDATRGRFLDEACAGDAALRERVEKLLRQSDQLGSFMEHSPVEADAVAGLGGEAMGHQEATVLYQNGSTEDDGLLAESEATSEDKTMRVNSRDDDDSNDEGSDEIPLGYLQPSSKTGSLGRLGHYEVLEVVGRGAFGTVLRAFDEKLQRVVAIKVLSPEMAATSPARKRFLREARTSAAIRHENVVAIHAVEDDPIPYLVMEFIPGQTLQQRLDHHGPLAVLDVLKIGKQIADGLAAAHAHDLIHRDIKPGNILLEGGVNERVKITDFGLARTADDASMTQSGLIAGTPMYMAPEQAMGQKLDQRADLFSFGSVLYQMLSGRPPFRAANTVAVLKRVVEDAPRPIQEIIPEVPTWMCELISQLHAKNPDERIQTAKEVSDLLGRCLDDLKAGRVPKLSCPAQITATTELRPATSSGSRETAQTSKSPLARIAAVVLLLPLMALAMTEFAGVTHLVQSKPETTTNRPSIAKPNDGVASTNVANADGWVSLFNGKDLTGWKTTDELPGEWSVKDGILTGRSQQSYLFSERADFANFHLRVEAKTNGLGGSGLHFRAPFVLRHGAKAVFTQPASGYEVDLFNQPAPIGTILEIVKGAPPRAMCLAANNSAYRAGEWFTLELIADGHRFVTKINGQETVDCQDAASRYSAGHLAISVFDPRTVVQFRKIEIKELPPTPASVPDPQPRFFASNEWIDVIPLIHPQSDKWDMRLTGKNEWRIEQGELVGGGADDKPHKLLLPVDADFFPSFECELEVTRRAGEQGFNLNFPTANGDAPLSFDFPAKRGVFVRHRPKGIMSLSESPAIETGIRTTFRVEVRRQQVGDRISVWKNDASVGMWTGDRNELVSGNNEGYEHRRRLSLWVHGGNEFVFHRIRVRMLDGGNAETVRPSSTAAPSNAPPSAIAPFDTAQAKAHQESWARHLGIDVEVTNSLVGKMILIPPGEFVMGTTPEQNALGQKILDEDGNSPDPNISRRLPAEMPQHRVVMTKPFLMAATEVTVARFRKFVDATGYETTADREGSGNTHRTKSEEVPANIRGRNWRNPGVPQADESPVSQVTWNDACVFCNWLSEQEQLSSWYQQNAVGDWQVSPQANGYRLPTEAEWEYACRAGTTTQFSFGDDPADLARYAWYSLPNKDGLQPVGTKLPNPFGLYGMHGNVSEFCQDAYDEQWYGISPELDPLQKNGSVIVARGGSWYAGPFECRSPSRKSYSRSHRYWSLGFRVVRPINAFPPSHQSGPQQARVPSVAPSLEAKTPDPAVVQGLRELVAAKEGERDQVKQSLLDGQSSKLDVVYAEIDAIEARIQLTQAERDTVASLRAYRHLIACREQERELIAQMVKAGTLKEDDLERADSSLSDAMARQAKAMAQAPASVDFTSNKAPRIAAEQVEAVRKELMRLNPKFDGKLEHKIEGDVVTELSVNTDEVEDIYPVQALKGLIYFDCRGTYPNKGKLSDLSPLKGMKLSRLDCSSTQVADLTPLTGLSLTALHFNHNPVSDLSPLKGMPLVRLHIVETGVRDLRPLQGLSLDDFRFIPRDITHGMEVLREMTSLKTIGVTDQVWPATEFWDRFDKGEFSK